MSIRRHLILATTLVLFPAGLYGQDSPTTIRVSGSGEVSLPPDYATLRVGVRVQDSSAETATDSMSARVESVVDTLTAMGFPRDSLPTRVFSVATDRGRNEGNRVVGYSAQVTLELRTSRLDRLAEFVGGVIAAGATEVGRISFGSTQANEARGQALELALQAAERDAQVIASARGGRLGRVVEITTNRGVRLAATTFESDIGTASPRPLSAYALTPHQISVRASLESVESTDRFVQEEYACFREQDPIFQRS